MGKDKDKKKKKQENKKGEKESSEDLESIPSSASLFNPSLLTSNKKTADPRCQAKAPSFESHIPVSEDEKQKDAMATMDFAKSILMKSKAGSIVSHDSEPSHKTKPVEQIKISTTSIATEKKGVKLKLKKKKELDIESDKVELGGKDEYIRFIGLISTDRTELFALNERYKYFLELGANLEYIATSILTGELDRMLLSPLDESGIQEMCYFYVENNLIFMVLGVFPDKKAAWLLNQLKVNAKEILGPNQEISKMEKIDLYNFSKQFKQRVKYLLGKYMDLQEVFTDRKLESLDDYLRIDYAGLSFQSIGVISKIITKELQIEGLPPVDPNDEDAEETMQELKESLITAKVEAMAANVVANTSLMPNWISVKIGFQHYRFLIFSKIQEYFISLLVEGNLELKEPILNNIEAILYEVTKSPFIGDLKPFIEIMPKFLDYINSR